MLRQLLTRPVRVLAVTAAAMLAVALTSQAATAAPDTNSAATQPAATTPAMTTDLAVTPMITHNAHGCPATFLCFWADINFLDNGRTGVFGKVAGTNRDWRDFPHSTCDTGTWHNCASSIFNNGTRCTAHLYTGTGPAAGDHFSLARGTGYFDLRKIGWSDRISSNFWC